MEGRNPPPERRFVLLGASNVAFAFPRLVHGLAAASPGPVEIFAAGGHGRSYGLDSQVLFRRLPGIRECGLWEALEAAPPAPAEALLTDVGNDLLYGVPVPTLVGWVEECIERLEGAGARIVLTLPPSASVARLPPWRYTLIRSLLFPGNSVPLERQA